MGQIERAKLQTGDAATVVVVTDAALVVELRTELVRLATELIAADMTDAVDDDDPVLDD